MSISIVDSIMGSGKSTWARNYMNSHPEYKWWYVTPYLTEIDNKVFPECNRLNMKQPQYDTLSPGSSKHDHLRKLIIDGENIATTHKLFLSISPNDEMLYHIQRQNYHLIIDEVPDVITANSITQDDIKYLEKSEIIKIDRDSLEITFINKDYKGVYKPLLDLSYSGKLYIPEKDVNAVIWIYKKIIFSVFDSIIVLTYLFNGSYLQSYFDLKGLKYQIDENILFTPAEKESATKERIKSHIDIYQGHLNDVGQKKGLTNQFSHNWYLNKKNEPYRKKLFNNAYNYLHNKCGARSDSALYTVFKEVAEQTPLRSYKKCFIPCNQRVSNDYQDRKYLAYLINMYENPALTTFFSRRTSHDQTTYALDSLLQWIWRSAIRKDPMEEIHIFIPSTRMRELLIDWLK